MCEYVIEHGRSHTCPLRRATFGEVVHMVGLIEGCGLLSILLKICLNRRVLRRVGGEEEETGLGKLLAEEGVADGAAVRYCCCIL
jgi:hypothetical protein